MKDNLRRLQLFLAISKIPVKLFYSINITPSDISLQGRFYPETAKLFSSWKTNISTNGYIEFNKNKFKVTLTD